MCFLKEFYLARNNLDFVQSKAQNSKMHMNFSSPLLSPFICFSQNQISNRLNFSGNLPENLRFLFKKVADNQLLIGNVLQKIDSCMEKMDEVEQQTEVQDAESSKQSIPKKIENFPQQQWNFSNSSENKNLKQKLFGSRNYRYKIDLGDGFPAQVFKERNFGFNVRLVDSKNHIIKNSNAIRVCLGVCDNEGKWISIGESCQEFLKGITQIQIYHGQGQFFKLSPRDISRGYRDRQLNLVIYPQPNSIKYVDSLNRYQQQIDSTQVEPLLIQKINIRAKRSKQ